MSFRETDALAEMHFGEWEGLTRPEIEARWGARATPFGGESFAQAESRILSFLAHAAEVADGPSPVLLVTHGMMIQLLMHAQSGNPLEQLYKTPFVVQASLTKVLVKPGLPPSSWEILSAGEVLP
ncbi:MAG: histidine phosphatase family protein [Spirochaetales bacterium]